METDRKGITMKIWRLFLIIMAVPLLLFISVAVSHQIGLAAISIGSIRLWGIILFILSVTFGIALPILMRTILYNYFRKNEKIEMADYLNLQRNLIALSAAALISASVAYLFIVSPLYLYGSVLAALYSIYGTLPFKAKIKQDLHMYMLQEKD